MKRLDLGVNVIPTERELIYDIDQLTQDDPTDATRNRDRNHNSRKDRKYTTGAKLLEQCDDRSQQERQSQRKGQRDQDLAREVQRSDHAEQYNHPSVVAESRSGDMPGGERIVFHRFGY